MVGTAKQLNGDHDTLPGSQAYSSTLTIIISIAQGMLSWLLCCYVCFSGLIICGSLILK